MLRVIILIFLSFFLVQDEPTISWNATDKLNWSDFQAEPKTYEDVIAVTASGLSFGYSTKRFSTGRIEYEFDVTAHFYPDKSWYVKEHVTDITLSHERLHFDITELHARKFRQRVSSFKFSQKIDDEMESLNAEIHDELRVMQNQYDLETSHSRLVPQQLKWQEYIKSELKKLNKFSY
ncbi:MAG: DUF922 domain-containing protein [Bacteroidia bacterium]|nr:DUF922 domain-containing protein [Bacteroidia bacterium]NND26160.1 DUF922 domain-containing protein [Flavobacteriaceae bacterium]MBT8278644.1 DUF922 domain-containing protein [Bacteroidia bacterium]NNK60473.1 DUF922 domain-containing protein [Flavobacteriaceae bacterium]NNL33070.1 DUF922 domain-containing protein [Flavobacteriaceae bacterium]